MAGILKVDRIQSDSNLAFAIAGSNVAFMNATSLQMAGSNVSLAGTNVITNGKVVTSAQPVGAVLQVVNTTATTSVSTLNTVGTNYVASGFIVTITPSSATSKVLLMCSSCIGNSAGASGMSVLFYRSIGGGGYSAIGSNGLATQYLNNITYVSYQVNMFGLNYLDSPGTTSAVSYQLYFQGNNGSPTGTCYLNGRNNDGLQEPQLNFTAMEIAG
jgi:hypothetical protein